MSALSFGPSGLIPSVLPEVNLYPRRPVVVILVLEREGMSFGEEIVLNQTFLAE
jgi:hypothetical protein